MVTESFEDGEGCNANERGTREAKGCFKWNEFVGEVTILHTTGFTNDERPF